MKARWWEALIVIALACAESSCATNKYSDVPRPDSDGVITQERVIDRDKCLDIAYCAGFAHYRTAFDPQVGVVSWLISDQGHACVVSDAEIVMARPNELFSCNWRFRRP